MYRFLCGSVFLGGGTGRVLGVFLFLLLCLSSLARWQTAELALAGDASLRQWCSPSLMGAVKDLRNRCDEMHPTVQRFCFIVPKVMGWHPKVSQQGRFDKRFDTTFDSSKR